MGGNDSCPHLPTRREEEAVEEGEWTASFFGCLADPATCLLTCVAPCVGAGLIAERLDGGTTHWLTGALVWVVLQELTSFGCIYSCFYRKKLRDMYNLPESPLPDVLVHWLCWYCAICQELRELKARETVYYGFDDDERPTRFAPPPWQVMGRD